MEKKLSQKEIENTGKEPYEPPKATFVPLKIEERLMVCLKLNAPIPCVTAAAS